MVVPWEGTGHPPSAHGGPAHPPGGASSMCGDIARRMPVIPLACGGHRARTRPAPVTPLPGAIVVPARHTNHAPLLTIWIRDHWHDHGLTPTHAAEWALRSILIATTAGAATGITLTTVAGCALLAR